LNRAVILIGVRQAGTLPPLMAVSSGVREMEAWARQQGINKIVSITDDCGPVKASEIKDAVNALLKLNTLQQLIVYFAGHGVNIGYGEYWLLSGAPEDSQEAVNVDGSVVLARQGSVPHVVLISDACRTAAEGIQAQQVTGSEIFPNRQEADEEQAVDLFFACGLGKPSLEIRDKYLSAGAYRAVYTNALVDALHGRGGASLLDVGPGNVRYVRPRPLKRHLKVEVPRVLQIARLPVTVSQTPDARITSDEDAWLAELLHHACPPTVGGPTVSSAGESPTPTGDESRGGGLLGSTPEPERASLDEIPRIRALASRAIESALNDYLELFDVSIGREIVEHTDSGSEEPTDVTSPAAVVPSNSVGNLFLATMERLEKVPVVRALTTRCGFFLRGEIAKDAVVVDGRLRGIHGDGGCLEIEPVGKRATVVIRLSDGAGVVLPVLRNQSATLTFEQGELIDVQYQRSPVRDVSALPGHDTERLQQLRAAIAAASQFGVLQFDRGVALKLSTAFRLNYRPDPALATYLAYGLHDIRLRGEIRDLLHSMRKVDRAGLLDVALLAGRQDWFGAVHEAHSLSAPLMSRGWSLLDAFRWRLSEPMSAMRGYLKPSLWTVIGPEGIAKLLSRATR
jgi:hypothetical protein